MKSAMALTLLLFSSLSMGCFGGDSDDGFEWPDPVSDGCHMSYDLECQTVLQLERLRIIPD